MKHQQVNTDYWAMGKAMIIYGSLTVLGWVMIKLFSMVFTMPSRMRAQQDLLQERIREMQRRFPDLNITEEELQNADAELDKICKEFEEEEKLKQNRTEVETAKEKDESETKTKSDKQIEDTKKTL